MRRTKTAEPKAPEPKWRISSWNADGPMMTHGYHGMDWHQRSTGNIGKLETEVFTSLAVWPYQIRSNNQQHIRSSSQVFPTRWWGSVPCPLGLTWWGFQDILYQPASPFEQVNCHVNPHAIKNSVLPTEMRKYKGTPSKNLDSAFDLNWMERLWWFKRDADATNDIARRSCVVLQRAELVGGLCICSICLSNGPVQFRIT